jgi:hypothetical protein
MAHVSRVAGVLPLLGAVVTAAALAGAAVFTVSQAACPNPGHYVQDGVSVQLVGGCFSRADLPATVSPAGPGDRAARIGGITLHGEASQNRP